ncbi:Ribosome biogenesis regulatory protein [Schizosaccharomyces pombe]|uniref:Ribosome biogenesis regulatory protein homolog n=1 Tax=Schizosaccharomyces pombe (strain 972 / ATCC 24843) TaxID=284812 RepID=RRS1_SCHPO|nr:putative ribosome biogenesis protein Rrs1 [Schizosaccharomyces pombe]O59678.1 RecName: Full=Ribosome biogenesis regulatory protein homolog [Schizosaccharomyces pombe 972h-]CAA18393.1 ribosome biogenesis protein Rrs1 (predicted) [Schizosaccharomyces pombe]|eukprot:NP_595844.1 putative ribosome biogenesis protein Rrs1 [Schizosaccharomyces pombe]
MSAQIENSIPLDFDLGNMAAFDISPLDETKLSGSEKESFLFSLSRDNVQQLVNKMISLPKERTSDGVLLQLPETVTPLPRAKPLPKPKPETKWQRFARIKGIAPKKREGRLVFDEASGEWVPKWGYKGKNKELETQWLVEEGEKEKKLTSKQVRNTSKKIKRSRRH